VCAHWSRVTRSFARSWGSLYSGSRLGGGAGE